MQSANTWLLVWAGETDWPAKVREIIARTDRSDAEAHHILSREVEGPRWSLLLVHCSREECDEIARALEAEWEYGFVNAVSEV